MNNYLFLVRGENDEICGTALIYIGAYNQLLSFINSLPEEPTNEDTCLLGHDYKNRDCENCNFELCKRFSKSASEDLDFLVISLEETIGTSPHSREVIKEHLQKAAELGRNRFEDKSEMVSEDLEEAEVSAIKKLGGMEPDDNVSYHEVKIFKAGAEWQKEKMNLILQTEYEKGLFDMQQEMMKDAVEGEYWIGEIHLDTPIIQGYDDGDRIKFIPIKSE